MGLRIDFQHDFADRCARMLLAANYQVPIGNEREVITAYATVRNRRVKTCQRTVHKAAYQVPAHLRAGEAQLLVKVQTGGDLWPHQSRKIETTAIEDGMLNDFGIQHFHLGTQPDAKHPNLMAGTKELLFAVVTDTDFYAVGIYDHNAWSQQALLDVIHATWPQLLDAFKVRSCAGLHVTGLSTQYSDADVAQLRAAGINVITQRPDGSIHVPLGGGVTTAHTGGKVAREVIAIYDMIARVEKDTAETLAHLIASGQLPPDITVRLEWRGDETFAVATPGSIEIDLRKCLSVPPL